MQRTWILLFIKIHGVCRLFILTQGVLFLYINYEICISFGMTYKVRSIIVPLYYKRVMSVVLT